MRCHHLTISAAVVDPDSTLPLRGQPLSGAPMALLLRARWASTWWTWWTRCLSCRTTPRSWRSCWRRSGRGAWLGARGRRAGAAHGPCMHARGASCMAARTRLGPPAPDKLCPALNLEPQRLPPPVLPGGPQRGPSCVQLWPVTSAALEPVPRVRAGPARAWCRRVIEKSHGLYMRAMLHPPGAVLGPTHDGARRAGSAQATATAGAAGGGGVRSQRRNVAMQVRAEG